MKDERWHLVERTIDNRYDPATQTYRLTVPGGWLYRTDVKTNKGGGGGGYGLEVVMVFVPTPVEFPQPESGRNARSNPDDDTTT